MRRKHCEARTAKKFSRKFRVILGRKNIWFVTGDNVVDSVDLDKSVCLRLINTPAATR
jgi:hypothetical protein